MVRQRSVPRNVSVGQIHEEFLSDVLLHGQNNGRLLRSRVPAVQPRSEPSERTLCQIRQVPVGLPHIERHRADYREPFRTVRHRDNQRQGGRHGCRPLGEERNRS